MRFGLGTAAAAVVLAATIVPAQAADDAFPGTPNANGACTGTEWVKTWSLYDNGTKRTDVKEEVARLRIYAKYADVPDDKTKGLTRPGTQYCQVLVIKKGVKVKKDTATQSLVATYWPDAKPKTATLADGKQFTKGISTLTSFNVQPSAKLVLENGRTAEVKPPVYKKVIEKK